MERLVEELYTFKGKVEDCENNYFISVQEKLRDYEKTNLYPNQIQDLLDFIRKHNGVVDEILEYKQLEEQGLLIRLPCKVGDTVWAFTPFCEICERYLDEEYICENCANDGSFVSETKFDYEMIPMIGKTVFLTKEEAEQALADMEK